MQDFVPVSCFPAVTQWPQDTYVVPQYFFACDASGVELAVSAEHTELAWLPYDEAYASLHYDSNRTALSELAQRLRSEDLGPQLYDSFHPSPPAPDDRAVSLVDLRDELDTPDVSRLLTAAFGSEDAAMRAAQRYKAGDRTGLGYHDAGVIVALIGFERESQEAARIRGIAVDPDQQREGIGRALVGALRSMTPGLTLHAETDHDAVRFYRACGFEATPLGEEYSSMERFECVLPAETSSDRLSPARVDYQRHGAAYARHRRTDPRIAARIHAALGDAQTVLNVGAGSGSYEPHDRWVLAVEPSSTMRAQRPRGAAPAIAARAEALPFDDDSVDAAMACLTIHHWEAPEAGLAELRRVARGPVVVFTLALDDLPVWQLEYLHEGLMLERPRFPTIDAVAAALGGRTRVERIPMPGDCLDGFFEAFWRRPEALLDGEVRASQSMWALLDRGLEERIVARLAAALASGAWDTSHGHLRDEDAFEGSLRLVISEPG